MPCGQASPRRVELIPRPPCGLLRSRSHCVARLRARSPHPSAPRGSPKSKANPQLRKKPFAFARARGPECASRTKTKTTGRAVFFIDPQTRTASSEIDFDYDELVSGAIIYAYLDSNPISKVDPSGLSPNSGSSNGSDNSETAGNSEQCGEKCQCWLTCLRDDPLLPELLPGLGAPLVNLKTPGEVRPGASSWTSVDRRLPPWTGANPNSGATVTRGAIQRIKCVGRYGTAAAAIGAFTAGYAVGAAGRCWVECQ